MRVVASDLVRLVNELVERRVKELLPEAVARVLSEQYVRKIVSERTQPARRSPLSQAVMEGEEDIDGEPVPQVRKSEDRGIYSDGAKLARESLRRKVSGGNPLLEMAMSGVSPIPDDDLAGAPEVPLDRLAQATGMDFGRMRQLASMGASQSSQPAGSSDQKSALAAKERELAARRAALDVPVPIAR